MLPYSGRPFRRLSVVTILLTPIYYLTPWPATGAAAEFIGIPFVLLYSLVLPGALVRHLLGWRRRDGFESVTTSLMFGLGAWYATGFVWALSASSLQTFSLVYPLAPVALSVLAWLRDDAPAEPVPIGPGRPLYAYVFGVLIVAVFTLVLVTSFPIDLSKDTIDHVGYVREIQESGLAFPSTAFYLNPGSDGYDIRKGLLHAFYGFASGYLGIDAFRFLVIINAFFSVVFLLVIYSVTLVFFGDRRVAVLAAFVFLIGAKGGLVAPTIRLSLYASRFGVLFYLYFLVPLLAALRTPGRNRDLFLCGFLACAACATHVFYAILVGAAVAVAALWKPFFPTDAWGTHIRKLVWPAIATLVGLLPYGLYRYIAHFPAANELHVEVQGVVFFGRHLYIAQPWRILEWWGPVGSVSILTIIPLWRHRGSSPALGYLMASFVTVPLILLNPLLLPPLHDVMTYLVFRLVLLCPFYIVTAYYLVKFFERWPAERPSFWGSILAALVIFACIVEIKPLATNSTFAPNKVARSRQNSHLKWQGAIDYLSRLPAKSVVVSDPATSYAIPALTSNRVVCTLDQHAPPNDLHLVERIRAARDIVSPFVSLRRTTELLAREHAEYIVLNNRLPSTMTLKYWVMDKTLFASSVAKFNNAPGIFDRVYDDGDVVIYRWSGEIAAPSPPPPNPYFVTDLPAGFDPIGRVAGEATLEGARLGDAGTGRGGALAIELAWRRDRPYTLDNYLVIVRLDHSAPSLWLGGKPWPKPGRRLKEMMTGTSYRLRASHKIYGGFLNPDTWDEMHIVLDDTTVRIPQNMVPGVYGVFVKLIIVSNKPNFYLRDMFYDDDSYQGVRIGEVSIE